MASRKGVVVIGLLGIAVLLLLVAISDFSTTVSVMTGGAIGGGNYGAGDSCLSDCILEFCEEGNQTCYLENEETCFDQC